MNPNKLELRRDQYVAGQTGSTKVHWRNLEEPDCKNNSSNRSGEGGMGSGRWISQLCLSKCFFRFAWHSVDSSGLECSCTPCNVPPWLLLTQVKGGGGVAVNFYFFLLGVNGDNKMTSVGALPRLWASWLVTRCQNVPAAPALRFTGVWSQGTEYGGCTHLTCEHHIAVSQLVHKQPWRWLTSCSYKTSRRGCRCRPIPTSCPLQYCECWLHSFTHLQHSLPTRHWKKQSTTTTVTW